MNVTNQTRQDPKSVIEFLEFLTKMFGKKDAAMEKFATDVEKWKKELKSLDLDLSDPKALEQLPKMLSAEQVSTLLSIFMQLTQLDAKYNISGDNTRKV